MFHPSKRMPDILPSASEGMRLSKEIQETKPCRKDLKTPKKKVDALTQRKNASLVKKVNSKDLPQGWTKEKVAMAYHMAGKRGGKAKFFKMWKDKYACLPLSRFLLGQFKKYVLERKDISNLKENDNHTLKNFILRLIPLQAFTTTFMHIS